MDNHRIRELANQYTAHDLIVTHTELPAYPEQRTRLLCAFLSGGTSESGQSELYALATSLAQLGLDTHDMVDPPPVASNGRARARQLRVLAGDYFNSRFYQLLSQAERIDIVRLVSKAICEVNRLKMMLYERIGELKMTADEYLEHCVSIKSELFVVFAALMPGKYAGWWPEVLRALTRCEIIAEEMERARSRKDARKGWAFLYLLQSTRGADRKNVLESDADGLFSWFAKFQIQSKLAQMLHHQMQHVARFIEQFGTDALAAEIRQAFEPFRSKISLAQTANEIPR